ncbi:MAG: 50S ribosomal protein L32 [Acidimicrobiia bacterium]
MPVPKRNTPRHKTRSRRSANMKIEAAAQSVCPNCGVVKLPHVVCSNCGTYKGRIAINVD